MKKAIINKPKELNMQNSRLTTKLRSALGFQSLAFVYAFLLAGSLGAQSVYTPYTFTTLAGQAPIGSADGTGSAARFWNPVGVATDSSGNVYVADTSNSTIRKGFLPPPQLTISLSGVPPSGIVLTWPTNAAGFTLQSATNLVSPVVWSTNSPAPVVIAGQNTITNPITGPQQFYRLIQ